MMYCDSGTSFQLIHFELFSDVVADHFHTISQEWITDLNNGTESLGYRIHGHTYPAHTIGYVSGLSKSVSREEFDATVFAVKG